MQKEGRKKEASKVLYMYVHVTVYDDRRCMTSYSIAFSSLQFLDDPTLALFSNTGGNLFMLKFK